MRKAAVPQIRMGFWVAYYNQGSPGTNESRTISTLHNIPQVVSMALKSPYLNSPYLIIRLKVSQDGLEQYARTCGCRREVVGRKAGRCKNLGGVLGLCDHENLPTFPTQRTLSAYD